MEIIISVSVLALALMYGSFTQKQFKQNNEMIARLNEIRDLLKQKK